MLGAVLTSIMQLRSIERSGAVEDMRQIAYETVLRACGFGSLAIFCVMIGLSFEPRAAFQAGGFLTDDDGHPRSEGLRGADQGLSPHRDVALSARRSGGRPKPLRNGRSRRSCARPISSSRCWTAIISIVMWASRCFFPSLERRTSERQVRPRSSRSAPKHDLSEGGYLLLRIML